MSATADAYTAFPILEKPSAREARIGALHESGKEGHLGLYGHLMVLLSGCLREAVALQDRELALSILGEQSSGQSRD